MTEPVTVGDLLTIGVDRIRRPSTVADLVSALRAEGVLVLRREGVDDPECSDCDHPTRHEWPEWAYRGMDRAEKAAYTQGRGRAWFHEYFDALAEAQPFPPAGR